MSPVLDLGSEKNKGVLVTGPASLTCEMAQRAAARGHPGRVTMLEPHFVFDLHDLPKVRLSGRSHTV